MTSTETARTECPFCHAPISTKSLKRHVDRKHADQQPDAVKVDEVFHELMGEVKPAEEVHIVTGVFLANGETYTGRVIQLTAQDFIRGSWDYYLIETADGDKVIVQTERAA